MSAVKPPPPQLSLEELLQLKWLLGGALTLLAASTVLYLGLGASGLLPPLVLVVAIGLVRPDYVAQVPRWVHRLAFPAIVSFFTLDLWLSGELLAATVRLDVLLLSYRGLVYRQRRDDLQIIVLGLFLVVLAGVLTVSLTFAAQILAFTAGSLALLLTLTLAQTHEPAAAKAAPPGPGEVPRWARHVDWFRLLARLRAVVRWRVIAFGAGLFVGLVAVSIVLFLVIPRFQLENSFFLERFVTKKARTGFSDTIRFGEVTEITEDNAVALSVDVSDRSQIPAAPYWRMLVLDDYRDGTFRVSSSLRRAFGSQLAGTALRGGARRRDASDSYWVFYLESGVSRFLPLLGPFVNLRFREAQTYHFARSLGIVALRSDPATMLAYRVEGMQTAASVPAADFAAQLRAFREHPRFTPGPMLAVGLGDGDRAVLAALVRTVSESRPLTAPEFAARASASLARQHAYSLHPKIPGGSGDPLVRWLRSNEPGHCELFAGSLVLLARTAGFPARVVTGFRGGTWNGYSNNFTLRNSDAHAWCEVFDEGAGAWLRVDPTPGASAAATDETRGDASLVRRLDRSWTARIESLRVFWYRRIVNFDQRAQLDTVQAVKDTALGAGRRLRALARQWGDQLHRWAEAPWSGRRVVGWATGLGAASLVLWLARRFRYRWAGRSRARGRADPVRREAGRWLRRFAGRDGGEGAPGPVVTDLQRLRFGARETWPRPDEVFRQARRAWRRRRRVS
jgi:transglutaminase-like putative cysteine protease